MPLQFSPRLSILWWRPRYYHKIVVMNTAVVWCDGWPAPWSRWCPGPPCHPPPWLGRPPPQPRTCWWCCPAPPARPRPPGGARIRQQVQDPPATPRGPLPPTWGPHHVSPRPGWGAALHGTPVPAGGCRRRQAVVPHQRRPGVYLCIAWQKLFLKRFFRNKQEHQSKVFIIKSPWSDHMFCDDSSGEHAKIFRMNTFHTWLDTSVRLADSFITSWCVGAPVN